MSRSALTQPDLNGRTLLHFAALLGYDGMATFLLEKTRKILDAPDLNGATRTNRERERERARAERDREKQREREREREKTRERERERERGLSFLAFSLLLPPLSILPPSSLLCSPIVASLSLSSRFSLTLLSPPSAARCGGGGAA